MSVTVSGRTFDHRELLKSLRGQWNNNTRVWTFDHYLSPADLARLRSLPGVVVVEHKRPATTWEPAKPTPSFREAISPDQLARVDAWVRRNRHLLADEDETFIRPKRPQIIGDDPTYFNYFADKNPIAYFGFSSLDVFIDHVERLRRPDNTGGTCDVGWSTEKPRQIVTDTPDMAAAIRLAREGWTAGLGLAEQFDIPHALRKRRVHSVVGASVNVGRMLAGNPAHMIRRIPQPKNKRIVVFVDTMMWKGITPQNAMLRALFIASAIDQLENQGYTCEIFAVNASDSFYDNGPQAQLCVRLKSAGERLNLLNISFALGHPSFLRRMFFACEGVIGAIRMTRHARGRISHCFDAEHQPGPNEYYFRQLPSVVNQELYKDDPLKMLDYILPDNLPIDFKRG